MRHTTAEGLISLCRNQSFLHSKPYLWVLNLISRQLDVDTTWIQSRNVDKLRSSLKYHLLGEVGFYVQCRCTSDQLHVVVGVCSVPDDQYME
jgi:hypothetical protein